MTMWLGCTLMALVHVLTDCQRLFSMLRAWLRASPALGCTLLALPHLLTDCQRLSLSSRCVLLASPHSLGWLARLFSAQRLIAVASPALGCVGFASHAD